MSALLTSHHHADGHCGIGRDDLPDDEPIEQHSHRRELLLDRRRRDFLLQLLNA